MNKVQVIENHYRFDRYVNKKRWASYYNQIKEVLAFYPQRVLVVGVGDGIIVEILRRHGIDVETIDYDSQLGVDYTMDVRDIKKLKKNYDVILCAQVLEHLPFSDFYITIKKLMECTSKLVLSLPIQHFRLLSFFKLQRLCTGKINFSVPKYSKVFKFDGQHHWEMNTKGYSRNKIISLIEQDFLITKQYTLAENVYHHFFIIEEKPSETKIA